MRAQSIPEKLFTKSQFLKVTHLCESSVDFPFDLTVSDSQDSRLSTRTQNCGST